MENNISFTGIKNLATVKLKREGFHEAKNLSMILTDDFNGKDLEEFKNILKKLDTKQSSFVNKEYHDLLNIEYLKGAQNHSWISINGSILKENDSNLPMFSYLAKLMKRISKQENIVVNETYKNHFAKDTLVYGIKIDNYDKLVQKGSIEKLFDKESVRETAEKFISHIQEIMNRYFGI